MSHLIVLSSVSSQHRVATECQYPHVEWNQDRIESGQYTIAIAMDCRLDKQYDLTCSLSDGSVVTGNRLVSSWGGPQQVTTLLICLLDGFSIPPTPVEQRATVGAHIVCQTFSPSRQ